MHTHGRTRTLASLVVTAAVVMSSQVAHSLDRQSPSGGTPAATVGSAATPAVVWVVGDLCDDDHAQADCDDVGRLIGEDPATNAVLALGDLQYENASLAKFNRFYDPKMGAGKGLWSRTFPAPGNHEYLTDGAAGYFDYWEGRAGDRSRGYYGATLGGWQVVAANSNCAQVRGCGASSLQGRFIAGYMDRAGACELVFDHHPAFSDGGQGDSAAGRALFAVTYRNRGELFLSGHDHNYQRFAPRRPDGTISLSTGVRQLVVGTGGKDLRGYRPDRHRTEYRQNSAYGALRLELTPGGYSGRFVSIEGTTMDTVSGTCRS